MMNAQDNILLQTKLHRPRLPKDLLQRTRLVELLQHDADRPLILVCAPAGFGKTTLVGAWLERMGDAQGEQNASLPAAWLSLDENDSELSVFLRYFIAALRTIFTGACEGTLALLQARQLPPQSVLFATLSNELEKLPGELILVLDDYHTLQGVEVHDLLSELVRHWPRPLHLVLISRTSPPIQLSGLRAKGMIGEIRTRDLRFTPEETAAYLDQASNFNVSQDALPLLEERFEGWPAGLHLAAISMRSEGNQETVLRALSSENANITGYLVDEVLTRQFPAIHAFLLRTSFLDRFCASLCEAVLGESDPAWDARACLDWIERSELFLVSLDNQRVWYRYHNLFQELLQQRLAAEMKPEQLNAMHRQASAWFEEHGLIEDALQHALAAGELDLAARLMNAGMREVVNREDRQTLERWLRLLPEEMIQRRPWLLMLRAWALEFAWRLNLQVQVIQQAEKLLDSEVGASLPLDEVQILRGQILTIKAQHAYFSNQSTLAIDLCWQALELLPSSWTFPRGGAMLYLGMSMQANGQMAEAERLLLEKYGSHGDKTDTYAMLILEALCFMYLFTSQQDRAILIAQMLLKGGIRSGMGVMKSWADWFFGVIAFQRNELQTAAQHFRLIFENRYIAQIAAYRDAVAGLALIHQVTGEAAEAQRMLNSISQFDLEMRGSEDNRTRSLRAHLMLLQGDLEGAGKWADTLTGPPPDMALMWLEEPQVTRARILLTRGSDADLHLAGQILDTLDEIADRTHNIRYKTEVLALRALTLDALGETDQALDILSQGLCLAPPGDYLRLFVDLGASMQKLLRLLIAEGHLEEDIHLGEVHNTLAAFPKAENDLAGHESSVQQVSLSYPGNSSLVEPLTPRELEILSLLRGPSSIKEIALQLNISYATAKRHMMNIYGKLGVNQRRNAVAKAEQLKIL